VRYKIILLLIIFLVFGCNPSLNSNSPDYLKQFTVYKDGDGIAIYFILADSSGQMTTCDGEAIISIRASHYDYKGELKLYDSGYPVRKDRFIKTKVGMGPFQHEAILYTLGRISFRSFPYNIESLKEKNWKGKVKFEFSSVGRFFKGEESFYF